MCIFGSAEGALPLTVKKDGSNVTVALFGVGCYHMLSGGTGSGRVHTPYITDMVEGLKNAGIGTTKMLTDVYNKYVPYARAKFQADNHTGEWFMQDAWGRGSPPCLPLQ